jgi:PEP-CTERM motif
MRYWVIPFLLRLWTPSPQHQPYDGVRATTQSTHHPASDRTAGCPWSGGGPNSGTCPLHEAAGNAWQAIRAEPQLHFVEFLYTQQVGEPIPPQQQYDFKHIAYNGLIFASNHYGATSKVVRRKRGNIMTNFVTRLRAFRLLGVVAMVVAFAGAAAADPVGGNVSVGFQNNQGTVSGFFQTDASGNVSTWDLQTSTFDCNPCTLDTGFPGIDYTPANSTSAVGFFFGDQSITFFGPNGFQLDFIIDCGGSSINCIANATLGSTLAVTGNELAMPDFLPFRALNAAIFDVTDPPVGLSFNIAPAANGIPEPGSLALIGVAFAGLAALRKRTV